MLATWRRQRRAKKMAIEERNRNVLIASCQTLDQAKRLMLEYRAEMHRKHDALVLCARLLFLVSLMLLFVTGYISWGNFHVD